MSYVEPDGEQPVGWALHAAGVATVALVIGVYSFFVYDRLMIRAESDSQRIEQLTSLMSESAEVQRKNRDLQQELRELESTVAAIRERLPHDMHQEVFAKELNRLAHEAGLQKLEFHWGATEVTPNSTQAQLRLECDGSYASICNFLDKVNQLNQITDIAHLQLEADPGSRNRPFQVTFVLYYGVDPAESDKNKGVL